MIAHVTLITARRPARLSKSVRRDLDGGLVRSGGGLLVEGEAKVREIGGLASFADLLAALGPAQALTYGIPRGGDGSILSRNLLAAWDHPAGTTTRTRDCFRWPIGAGVMMLDHDPVPGGEAMDRDALVGAIRTAEPGLAEAAMLWWPSASSHIHDRATGDDLTGLRGQRLYTLVAEAGDIPRAGAALVDRLWAAGLGRIVASAAGSALERCPVDASVWQPERLDFAAGAVCGPGLAQRRGVPRLIPGGVEVVDTRSVLPDDPDIRRAADAVNPGDKLDHGIGRIA